MDIAGKRITIAGKLAGAYAQARRDLAARVAHLGAELSEAFDTRADIVVVAAKSKGFRARIAKMNAIEITEAELEAAVADAYATPPSPPQRATVWTFLRALATMGHIDPVARRARLIEVICDHAERGYRFDLEESPTSSAFGAVRGDPRTLLTWCGFECSLVVLPDDLDAAIARDVSSLDGARVAYGGGFPIERYAAAMRVMTAMGFGAERVWRKMKHDLDDYEELWSHAGLASIDDLRRVGTPLATGVLRTAAQLTFPIGRMIVVHDDIAW